MVLKVTPSASSVRQRPSASHPVGGAGGPPVGLRTPSRRVHRKGSFNSTQEAVYTSLSSLMEGSPQDDSMRLISL